MYTVVLQQLGFSCCVNTHACQKKMYAVNKIPLGNWVEVGLYCWKAFAINILSCCVLSSQSSAVS